MSVVGFAVRDILNVDMLVMMAECVTTVVMWALSLTKGLPTPRAQQAGRQAGRQADSRRQAEKQAEKQADRQMDRRQTDGWTDRSKKHQKALVGDFAGQGLHQGALR